MNTEKLKVIAEGMGYTWFDVDNNEAIKDVRSFTTSYKPITKRSYRPDTTNNDQMVEIMEKLKIDIRWIDGDCFATSEDAIGKGKTINEAVCNAALEYFKR